MQNQLQLSTFIWLPCATCTCTSRFEWSHCLIARLTTEVMGRTLQCGRRGSWLPACSWPAQLIRWGQVERERGCGIRTLETAEATHPGEWDVMNHVHVLYMLPSPPSTHGARCVVHYLHTHIDISRRLQGTRCEPLIMCIRNHRQVQVHNTDYMYILDSWQVHMSLF